MAKNIKDTVENVKIKSKTAVQTKISQIDNKLNQETLQHSSNIEKIASR